MSFFHAGPDAEKIVKSPPLRFRILCRIMKNNEGGGLMAILLVEDDHAISDLLAEFLRENGYAVRCRYDGLRLAEALEGVELVLLDLMLPYESGEQALTDIRATSTVPVIVISAKGATQSKIDLLRLGADDYITKPFDLEEVLARIESVLRRSHALNMPETLQHGALTLDLANHTATAGGKPLTLTAKEFAILALLVQYPEKIFSKANLFESVWSTEYLSEDNTLNVHISNLRNKLKTACPDENFIDTVWGIGYRLHKTME